MNINFNSSNVSKIVRTGVETVSDVAPKIATITDDTVTFTKKSMSKALTKLSKIVDFRPANREYRFVSLPNGLDIIDGKLDGKASVPTLAIIDVFSDFGNYKMGKKIKIPHGNLVSKFATQGLDDKIGVLAIDTTPKGKSEWLAMQEALEDIVKYIREGLDIKALNLSIGVPTDYDTISTGLRKEVTTKNISECKDEIIEYLSKSTKAKDKNTIGMINAINQLVDDGVQVYLASGNNNGMGVDLLSLSKAQHIVGADDYEKATEMFSNSSAKGVHTFSVLYDTVGNILGLTDGKINIYASELKDIPKQKGGFLSGILKEKEVTIKGTSFSCPLKLNEDLKKIL